MFCPRFPRILGWGPDPQSLRRGCIWRWALGKLRPLGWPSSMVTGILIEEGIRTQTPAEGPRGDTAQGRGLGSQPPRNLGLRAA